MTKRQNRDTYLREDEVLQRVVDTSRKIADFLARQRNETQDERSQMQLDNLLELQNELTERIAEYGNKAPWQFHETYMQYVDVGSGKVDDMIRDSHPRDLDDLIETAIALNRTLAEELEPASENAGVEASHDAFANLQSLVEENCRRISLSRSMSGDM